MMGWDTLISGSDNPYPKAVSYTHLFRGLLVTPNFDRDLSYDQIAPLGKFRLIVKNNGLSQVNYNLDNNLIKVLLFKKCSTIK